MADPLGLDDRTATFSDCGRYRYDLTRRWGPGDLALWVMLNPSTADAVVDDPTIRRCIRFSLREGAGGLVVTNLFALRSTNPVGLLDAGDPTGPTNKETICRWLADGRVGWCVAAWGAWWTNARHHPPRLNIEQFAADAGRTLLCLGTTTAGDPRHPLYVPRDRPLEPYGARS